MRVTSLSFFILAFYLFFHYTRIMNHKSVLLQEILHYFKDLSIKRFIDGTLGAGGHAAAILESHPEIEQFIGIDQDPEAITIAENRLSPWKDKVTIIRGNFLDVIQSQNDPVDGILLDLGVSSMQLDRPEKGFSFMKEGPLDMRMDPSNKLTAAIIVNTWSEKEIGRVIRDYGEEKRWRLAARAIVEARKKEPILTTLQLEKLLYPVLRTQQKGIHPLTLTFQGLRIAVNRELEVLEKGLPIAIDLLKPDGLLAIISFHSLEDRLVKNAFRYASSDKEDTSGNRGVFIDKQPLVDIMTRKPIEPTPEEIQSNPRSRSSKLRIIKKILFPIK
jgi:16S rRNA (cytosine1402-N4)-methyltransferase